MERKIPASERRILLTRWVGNAWDHIRSNREMVKRSFEKCGINVNIDGSENVLVHGISEYSIPEPEEESHVDTSTDENDTSGEGDFELTNEEETVDAVEVP